MRILLTLLVICLAVAAIKQVGPPDTSVLSGLSVDKGVYKGPSDPGVDDGVLKELRGRSGGQNFN